MQSKMVNMKKDRQKKIDEEARQRCMIMPNNKLYASWDVFITLVLVFSCVTTPIQIALQDDLGTAWITVNAMVDIFFLLDIFVSFMTAIYDDDFELIEDRTIIAQTYLKGWFFIDVISIMPFDRMISGSSNGDTSVEDSSASSGISRLTKVLKLIKLLRLAKLNKGSSAELFDKIQEFFGITQSFKWMFGFFFAFISFAHLICCFWIIISNFDPSDQAWITLAEGTPKSEIYLTSFYYTITTITTVGYGDISPNTFTEKIVGIIIMFAGVIAFSLASGSLTNYIMQ